MTMKFFVIGCIQKFSWDFNVPTLIILARFLGCLNPMLLYYI